MRKVARQKPGPPGVPVETIGPSFPTGPAYRNGLLYSDLVYFSLSRVIASLPAS